MSRTSRIYIVAIASLVAVGVLRAMAWTQDYDVTDVNMRGVVLSLTSTTIRAGDTFKLRIEYRHELPINTANPAAPPMVLDAAGNMYFRTVREIVRLSGVNESIVRPSQTPRLTKEDVERLSTYPSGEVVERIERALKVSAGVMEGEQYERLLLFLESLRAGSPVNLVEERTCDDGGAVGISGNAPPAMARRDRIFVVLKATPSGRYEMRFPRGYLCGEWRAEESRFPVRVR